MKYIFIRLFVVYSWRGKCVLGCINSFSSLKESSKGTQGLVSSFPPILIDTFKDITIPDSSSLDPVAGTTTSGGSWPSPGLLHGNV